EEVVEPGPRRRGVEERSVVVAAGVLEEPAERLPLVRAAILGIVEPIAEGDPVERRDLVIERAPLDGDRERAAAVGVAELRELAKLRPEASEVGEVLGRRAPRRREETL